MRAVLDEFDSMVRLADELGPCAHLDRVPLGWQNRAERSVDLIALFVTPGVVVLPTGRRLPVRVRLIEPFVLGHRRGVRPDLADVLSSWLCAGRFSFDDHMFPPMRCPLVCESTRPGITSRPSSRSAGSIVASSPLGSSVPGWVASTWVNRSSSPVRPHSSPNTLGGRSEMRGARGAVGPDSHL